MIIWLGHIGIFHHEQDVTQGQFLSSELLVRIQSCLSLRMQKECSLPYNLPIDGGRTWTHAFPKDINTKKNTNNHVL